MHITDGMVWKAAHEFVKAFVCVLKVITVHLAQAAAQESVNLGGNLELRLSMSERRRREEKEEEGK
jgi:hypothetical protein